MNDKSQIDEKIGRLVRSIDKEIPVGLDDRIRLAAEAADEDGAPKRFFLKPLVLSIGGAAGVVLLTLLFVFPALTRRKSPLISEIRTEFEIPEENIKVIFIQRSDFKLPQEVRE